MEYQRSWKNMRESEGKNQGKKSEVKRERQRRICRQTDQQRQRDGQKINKKDSIDTGRRIY